MKQDISIQLVRSVLQDKDECSTEYPESHNQTIPSDSFLEPQEILSSGLLDHRDWSQKP